MYVCVRGADRKRNLFIGKSGKSTRPLKVILRENRNVYGLRVLKPVEARVIIGYTF